MTELIGLVFSVAFVAGVIGNLTASLILGFPAVLSLHKKLDRNHRATLERRHNE